MNMSVDIDNFIREQKSKIATERQYLSNQNLSYKKPDPDLKTNISSDDNFVFKMKEGENMRNKYKQELRNEFTNVMEYNKHVEQSPRADKSVNNANPNNGLLPGLGYSNSAAKRREHLRNQEYNEFKKIDAENFKNRFLNKKNVGPPLQYGRRNNNYNNPITTEPTIVPRRIVNVESQHQAVIGRQQSTVTNNKLDELEQKVDDLRRLKIHDIDLSPRRFSEEITPIIVDQSRLRSLDDTEQQLRMIDQKYEESKSRIMKSYRPNKKTFRSILDDETVLETELMDKRSDKTKKGNEPNYHQSIIPLGRTDADTMKRLKQEQYRNDLQSQMMEKLQKSKSVEFIGQDDISFFDRFGGDRAGDRNRNRSGDVGGKRPDRKSESARFIDSKENNDYAYYASRNPLDDYGNSPYVPSSFNIGGNLSPRRQSASTMYRNSYTDLGSDNKLKNQSQKNSYGDELKKQIEERKQRKEIDKKHQDEYERRKNEEIMNYDPFGRGGGGAPLKDIRGETIADLKNYKFDSNITIPPSSVRVKSDYYYPDSALAMQLKPQIDISATNEGKTFARGGHGIFGQALSDEAKIKNERYKEELELQIDGKKRQREMEKENERIRDAKELEKLEKEQKLIRLELDNEKKLQMQKEIERMQRLDESRVAAKDKKIREKELELERDREEVKLEQPYYRPALLSPYQFRQDSPKPRQKSPPLEREVATTPMSATRENHNEITNKLQILRNEIKNRAAQVELELARQNDEVEIFDARLVKKEEQNTHDYNSTIFQSVLDNKGPLSVRRGNVKPKPRNNEKSRQETEAYLDAHLKQQEKILERMGQTDFSPFELGGVDKMNPRDLGMRPQSQMSNQLESDTNFITFNQSREFPLKSSLSFLSDNEYSFHKPLKLSNELGSNTSLNIDDLTRKNKRRLRKLQKSQQENESNQNPEDILNKIRFMDNNELHSYNGH